MFLEFNCNCSSCFSLFINFFLSIYFFGQRQTILSLGPQVKNVIHIPKEIFKTKPILNSCKNLKKDSKQKSTI